MNDIPYLSREGYTIVRVLAAVVADWALMRGVQLDEMTAKHERQAKRATRKRRKK